MRKGLPDRMIRDSTQETAGCNPADRMEGASGRPPFIMSGIAGAEAEKASPCVENMVSLNAGYMRTLDT